MDSASSSPFYFFGYFLDHRSQDLGWFWDHTWLSVVLVLVGLVQRCRWAGWRAKR